MASISDFTTSAFFYGTLMSPAILARVTGRNDLTARPAILHNHRRHRVAGADYPAIVPAQGSTVRGTYVTGLTRNDIYRLDVFEGEEYDRVPAKVDLLRTETNPDADVLPPSADGGVEAQAACQTYVWQAPRAQLEEKEWDFDEFVREKLWRWAPGAEGEKSGEYEELDRAVQQNDPTRGRAVGGGFEDAVKQ